MLRAMRYTPRAALQPCVHYVCMSTQAQRSFHLLRGAGSSGAARKRVQVRANNVAQEAMLSRRHEQVGGQHSATRVLQQYLRRVLSSAAASCM